MRTIFKYQVPEPGLSRMVEVPATHKPVHVGQDPSGTWCVWMEVDDLQPRAKIQLLTVGTGHPIPPGYKHCGSLVQGPFVWHVYHG